MTTITLPDAIVKALEAHNVQDVSAFTARAILHELEYMDEEDEIDEEHELSMEELERLKGQLESFRQGEKTYSIEEMKAHFKENREKATK
jgi:hypothetical protein